MELTSFLHFGLGTFDGTEYGDSSEDVPSLFNPTDLDAQHWASALKAAGFNQAMLTTKHATGFCLWPSEYTDYSVRSSPWKNGQGDVVREFVEATRAAGLRIGFYLSPWDEHYPSTSPSYETYFRNQLTELLTGYGPIHEIEFDGYRAPTSLDWKGIVGQAKAIQPDVLVWMGWEIATSGADLRYLGNQNGQASRKTTSIGDIPGAGGATMWYPNEAPVSDRGSKWFWHPGDPVISLKSLQQIYFSTVGMNTTLLLNVPPATTGKFDVSDLGLLQQFGQWHSSLFRTNLLRGAAAFGDSSWPSAGFGPSQSVDDDVCTYWAAGSARTSGRLEVTPVAPITFTVISLREPIEIGERTTAYHIELKQNGVWNKSPSDASGAKLQGTVIGGRQLWQLNPTTAESIALAIDSAKDVPAIAELGAY